MEQSINSEKGNNLSQKPAIKRRTLLKALIGLPVLGVFAFELFKKWTFDQEKKKRILRELGLENMQAPVILKNQSGGHSELLRIGLIGFGSRAVTHANGLGFMHPEDVDALKKSDSLNDWLAQENLNVAITGICDVLIFTLSVDLQQPGILFVPVAELRPVSLSKGITPIRKCLMIKILMLL